MHRMQSEPFFTYLKVRVRQVRIASGTFSPLLRDRGM